MNFFRRLLHELKNLRFAEKETNRLYFLFQVYCPFSLLKGDLKETMTKSFVAALALASLAFGTASAQPLTPEQHAALLPALFVV
jgi:hypothetical protein